VSYDPRAGRYLAGAAFGLPAPRPPVVDGKALELLLRFEHPAKFLAVKELPGAVLVEDDCLAALYGAPPAALPGIRRRLAGELREAAGRLLEEPGLRAAVSAFPVAAGGKLVALGDSITDDTQSWAELLRCCLARERPGAVTVVNAGVSGDTTADVLRRLHGVAELRPELVIGMLGTNDCQRHGPEGAPLVLPGAACDAIAAISRWLRAAGARVVWLTPPPVDREALRDAVGERPVDLHPHDLARLSEHLRESELEVIDAGSRLTREHLLPDGVHPSLAGQVVIARAVLQGLAVSRPA
jgi:acyl-CoA thioesterase I